MAIGVSLLEMNVQSFSAKDGSVMLEIHFDDGEEKQIYKTTKLEKPEEIVKEIYSELVKMEQNINKRFDGKNMVGDHDVIIKDKNKNKEKIVFFLENLRIMAANVKSMKVADGYLKRIADINSMELKL